VQVQLIENLSAEEIAAQIHQGKAHLALDGWETDYPDPDDILRVLFHSTSPINYFGWQNHQFDQWVQQAANLSNQRERLRLYHQADRLLVAEDTAIVPLCYGQGYTLLRRGFQLKDAGKIIRGGVFKFKNISVT
jgi:ABC-type oligopeptide transport system substrate-binding subunit